MTAIDTKTSGRWDFPGGPAVKNQPWNAGDTGLILGQGTKAPYAAEPTFCRVRVWWTSRVLPLRSDAAK